MESRQRRRGESRGKKDGIVGEQALKYADTETTRLRVAGVTGHSTFSPLRPWLTSRVLGEHLEPQRWTFRMDVGAEFDSLARRFCRHEVSGNPWKDGGGGFLIEHSVAGCQSLSAGGKSDLLVARVLLPTRYYASRSERRYGYPR